MKLRQLFSRKVLTHGLFFSWNFIFIAVVFAGLLPHHLLDILLEIFDGLIPLNFAISAALLCAIPVLATTVGILFLRRDSARLLRLFYGIEAPLMLAALARLFLLRELPPAMVMLVVVLALCLITYGYELLHGGTAKAETGRLAAWALFAGGSLGLLGGVYVATVLLFYAVPLGVQTVKVFIEFEWLSALWRLWHHSHGREVVIVPLAMLLLFYSATLLVALPAVMLGLYVGLFRRASRMIAARSGWPLAAIAAVAFMAAQAALFVRLSRQPHRAVLETLSRPPVSDAERQALRGRADEIRAGLLEAYLAPHRYLSATGSNDHIAVLYTKVLHVSPRFAARLQKASNFLLAPVLYDGDSLHADRELAEQRYEQFFDAPIQKGERAAILRAMQTTYDRDRREAGLLNVGERKVWLKRQEVKVQEFGDFAEIELHETYQNQTIEQQEIFYYFSLPESAAITGLWLGDSEEPGQRYAFTISPRGAAQKVYRAEVQRRLDPALLEQVGPRQYRLRAFPIPPRPPLHTQKSFERAPPFHLWMTYKVLRKDGGWPLPALIERRNAYLTADSERVIAGVKSRTAGRVGAPADEWLPASVPAAAGPGQAHSLSFPSGYRVRATPLDAIRLPTPSGQRYAVVLDRSASMERHAAAVSALFGWLQREIAVRNQIDLYLAAAPTRGEAPSRVDNLAGTSFAPERVVYFGGQRASELLAQFAALQGGQRYAAVVIVTDDGSMDLARDREPISDFLAPVYMVHLGGALPPGYDDATLASIQKRGGAVTTDIREVFRSLAAAAQVGPSFVGLDSGMLWTVEPMASFSADGAGAGPGPVPAPSLADPFSPLAGRQLIKASVQAADLNAVQSLDALHRLAKACSIVSPYSSMIVLIDERQREALRKAEQEAGRFDRTVESGSERTTTPSDFLVTGTPEPAEWLLIVLVGLGLLFLHLRRRSTAIRNVQREGEAMNGSVEVTDAPPSNFFGAST